MYIYKSFDEAATAVDEMFNTAYQNAGCKHVPPLFVFPAEAHLA